METTETIGAVEMNFVTFYSPGTFVAETSTSPIEVWDVVTATTLAREIRERHGVQS